MINNNEKIKELISAYIDGFVTEEEKKEVEDLIINSKEWQDYYKELNRLSTALKDWSDEDVSADMANKIQKTLLDDKLREKNMNRKSIFSFGGGAFVTIAICLIIGTIYFQTYGKKNIQQRLKSASDDIGDQFSVVDTSIVKRTVSASVPTVTSAERKADTAEPQYEPYYLTTSYLKPSESESGSAIESFGAGEKIASSKDARYRQGADGYQSSEYARSDSANMDTFAPIQSKKEGVPQDDLPRGAALGGLRMEQVAQKTKGSATYARHPAAVPPASDETILEAQRRYFESNEINSTENNRMPAYREDDYKDRIIYPDPAERIYPYPQPQSNSEEYDSIFENSFYSAVNAPLSTFSVDVDTASYSNIRRFVDQGQLPPIDAVRIEEMINYFDYQYEKPKWGEAFSVTTKGGICPWDNSHYLVMIGLQGNVPAQNKIPPSNLVFLIDVSGSMNQSNKLPLLKESLNMMVDQLRPDQRVAIVTYSGSARLYLDSTTGADKGRIHQAIDRLTAGGATAGEAGINLAYRVAKDNFISNGNNRVILATDGDFNVGAQNDYELTELITQRRKDGIFLSVLGFGTGNYKDSKMEKIADNGNGNYHYIDSIDEGKKVLVDELGSTLFTIAKDVKIQVEFNPQQVQAYRLIGYENRSLNSEDFNNDRVDAGEIGAGHTVTALYEIIPNGAAPSAAYPTKGVDPLKYQKTKINLWENSEWMTVKLRFKEPKSNQSRLIKSIVHANDVRAYTSGDLQFASAVAEFGLLLKNSRYKGYANYDHVMEQARQSIGIDPDQHREEFIRLVDQAKQLDHRYQGYSQPQPYPMDNTYYDNNQYPTETPPMQFK